MIYHKLYFKILFDIFSLVEHYKEYLNMNFQLHRVQQLESEQLLDLWN